MDEPRLAISDTLVIGFDSSSEKDVSVMSVCKYSGLTLVSVNTVTGKDAEDLYSKLMGGVINTYGPA